MKKDLKKSFKLIILLLVILSSVFIFFSCNLSGKLNDNNNNKEEKPIVKKDIYLEIKAIEKTYDGTKKANLDIKYHFDDINFTTADFIYDASYNSREVVDNNYITIDSIKFKDLKNNDKYNIKYSKNPIYSNIKKKIIDIDNDLIFENTTKIFDDTKDTKNFLIKIKDVSDVDILNILSSEYDSKDVGERIINFSISLNTENKNYSFINTSNLENRQTEGKIIEKSSDVNQGINSVYYTTVSKQNQTTEEDALTIKLARQNPSVSILNANVKNINLNDSSYIELINDAEFSKLILKNKLLNTFDIGEANDIEIKLSNSQKFKFNLRVIREGYLLKSKVEAYTVIDNQSLVIDYTTQDNLNVEKVQIDDQIFDINGTDIAINKSAKQVTLLKNFIKQFDSKTHRIGLIYTFDYPFGFDSSVKVPGGEFTTYFNADFETGIIKNPIIERKERNKYVLKLQEPKGILSAKLLYNSTEIGTLDENFEIEFNPFDFTGEIIENVKEFNFTLRTINSENYTVNNNIKIKLVKDQKYFSNKINLEGKKIPRIIENKEQLYKLAATMYSELQFSYLKLQNIGDTYKTSNNFLTVKKSSTSSENQVAGYDYDMSIYTDEFLVLYELPSNILDEIINNYAAIVGTHISSVSLSKKSKTGYTIIEKLEIISPKSDLYNMIDPYYPIYQNKGGTEVDQTKDKSYVTINRDTLKYDQYSEYIPKAKILYQQSEYKVSNEIDLYLTLLNNIYPDVEENSLADRELKKAIQINKSILSPMMSDYEKVISIADYIATNYHYDNFLVTGNTDNIANNANPSYTAASLLSIVEDGNKSNIAVCNGLALTFTILTKLEAIETVEQNGEAGKKDGLGRRGGHAWAKVKIGDYGYFFDITWNMPINNDQQDFRRTWSFQNRYIYENLVDDLYNDDNAHIPNKSVLKDILINDMFYNLYANINIRKINALSLENDVLNLFITEENKDNELNIIKNILGISKIILANSNLGAITFKNYTHHFTNYKSSNQLLTYFYHSLTYVYDGIDETNDYAIMNRECFIKNV